MNNYNDYFKKQYKVRFTSDDVETYNKWFYAQWRLISKKVQFQKNNRILEIGSGIGTLYSFLQNVMHEENYVGLELDKTACDFANKHFKTKSFKNIPIEKYTISKKFDYVFAFEVLEHIDDPNGVIEKIKSSLTNGGALIGTSPYPYVKNIYADKTHRYVLHPKNWEKLLKDAGFSKIETYPESFLPYIWRINKHLNFRIPFYIPFPYCISTTLIIAHV